MSCGSSMSSNSLGDAYVAPTSLNLHSSLGTKSSTVAVLQHGDHLAVVDVRRRFVKVRTDKGAEGWLDSRQLLSKDQMDEIRKASQQEMRLPSQGRATTFDILNVHIDPDRHSPPFAQIPAGGSVEVLAHKAIPKSNPRETPPGPSFLKSAPKPVKRPRHPKQQKNLSPRPPMPPAPKPPENWMDLSAERIDGLSRTEADKLDAQKKSEAETKPVILEDWTLVRTKDKKVGWVLSRNLYMAIPDDVAQYAEGQRISSYFDLGQVQDDEKGVRHHWLWTTSAKAQPFDFDRFRVFIWNRRRHRYETSYRQKDLVGYFPVEVEPAVTGDTRRYFSFILQDESGRYSKKRYAFDGTLVRLVSTEPYQPAADSGPTKAAPLEPEKMEAKKPRAGWWQRQVLRVKRMLRR
jgi:uncharacterized protein YgiM (DUF1202 family)